MARDTSFDRRNADKWHDEVPGARWFRVDLHTHTMDDHPGGRAKMPVGVVGPLQSDQAVTAYARKFLQGAVVNQIQVLGVTPHSPRLSGDLSAAWRIVTEWNEGLDDDGEPFRDKIYAVFPGFEPSLKDGQSGLHLLFLFDPEIGKHNYLTAFDIVMGGVSPWSNGDLRTSAKSSDVAFKELREFHQAESDAGCEWNYLVVAPHIENTKGLLGAMKSQVLAMFDHREIAALELGDNKLPEDTCRNRRWLREGMAAHRQAFLHGSDAYSVTDVGQRYTWVKLAKPRIEALRQAFVASDSRMRLAYRRSAEGDLAQISEAPDVTVYERPWLKTVAVAGGASFFRREGSNASTRFALSPDLTCIIGGSMTGKSTFLDGLRVHVGADLPKDDQLRKHVEDRGQSLFLGGSPDIQLDCPGQDPTDTLDNRWPAVFYTQNELQKLSQQSSMVEDILARLNATEMPAIMRRQEQLASLDRSLAESAKQLAKLDDDVAEAEQARTRADKAASELAAIADAGIADLHRAARQTQRWQGAEEHLRRLAGDVERLLDSANSMGPPWQDDEEEPRPEDPSLSGRTALAEQWGRAHDALSAAKSELSDTSDATKEVAQAWSEREHAIREDVGRRLAELGMDRARISEFQSLSRQAAMLPSYRAALEDVMRRRSKSEGTFDAGCRRRRELIAKQQSAFDSVIDAIGKQFGGRIRVRRIDEGNRVPLERFIKALAQRGLSRWWNDLPEGSRPGAAELLAKTAANDLLAIGMSVAVQATFRQCLTPAVRRELAAIRCRDRYVLELKMDDGSYRILDALSGGQRVSVLLSLLLETNDNRPLVIDQPEDELDNRFLFDTVLPALKRLKGRRQIIVATHDANIVVNGDADQVIQLEATASRGRVAHAGAIDESTMRDAIVRTVDGGDEAFRLRQLKYGF